MINKHLSPGDLILFKNFSDKSHRAKRIGVILNYNLQIYKVLIINYYNKSTIRKIPWVDLKRMMMLE